MKFCCPECDYITNKKSKLLKHQRSVNYWEKFDCNICGKVFTRKDNLDRHVYKHRNENSFHCSECGCAFSREDNLSRHLRDKHQIGGGRKRAGTPTSEASAPKFRKHTDAREYYNLSKVNERIIKKFRTKSSTYKATFKNLEVVELQDILTTLKALFSSIFNKITKGSKTNDLVRIVVQSPTLDYPIVIPFILVSALTADRFLQEVERVLQSNEDFVINESLTFEITLVDMPSGGAQKRCKFVNNDRFLLEKKCIIRIKNSDNLCCARAIVTAKARIDKHEKWESIRKGYEPQGDLARTLHKAASVKEGQSGIEEIKQFQTVLEGYQLHVLSKEHFNAIIYIGPETENKIYLYYREEHYEVITSMSAFLTRNYFSTTCNKGYDHKDKHVCNNICSSCRKVHEKNELHDWIHCETCNRYFQGQECYDLHATTTYKGNSICKTYYRCAECSTTINRKMHKKDHVCGERYCDKIFVSGTHQCFMLPEETADNMPMRIEEELINEEETAKTFIFFDFECSQEDIIACNMGYLQDSTGVCSNCNKTTCGSFEHKPNLCVVHKVCTNCMANEVTSSSKCENCDKMNAYSKETRP